MSHMSHNGTKRFVKREHEANFIDIDQLERQRPTKTSPQQGFSGNAGQFSGSKLSRKVRFDDEDEETDYECVDAWVDPIAACAGCRSNHTKCQVNFTRASSCYPCTRSKLKCSFVPTITDENDEVVDLEPRLAKFRILHWQKEMKIMKAKGVRDLPDTPTPMSLVAVEKKWNWRVQKEPKRRTSSSTKRSQSRQPQHFAKQSSSDLEEGSSAVKLGNGKESPQRKRRRVQGPPEKTSQQCDDDSIHLLVRIQEAVTKLANTVNSLESEVQRQRQLRNS